MVLDLLAWLDARLHPKKDPTGELREAVAGAASLSKVKALCNGLVSNDAFLEAARESVRDEFRLTAEELAALPARTVAGNAHRVVVADDDWRFRVRRRG